MSHFRGCPE